MSEQRINNGNAAAIGFAGAIIGAGVAVAASRILQDKQAREKVTDALTEVKKQVMQSMKTIKIDTGEGPNGTGKTMAVKASPKKALASPKKETKKTKAES